MSSTKKTTAKAVAKAPTKADTLRALRFLRKTLLECRIYDSRLYSKYETEDRAWRDAETARKAAFVGKIPPATLQSAIVGLVGEGKSLTDISDFITKQGYKPAPAPAHPREAQQIMLEDIDKAIFNAMLGDFDSGIVAVFVKRIEDFK